MGKDIRETALYPVQGAATTRREQISDAAEVRVSPRQTCRVYRRLMDRLDGARLTRICQVEPRVVRYPRIDLRTEFRSLAQIVQLKPTHRVLVRPSQGAYGCDNQRVG